MVLYCARFATSEDVSLCIEMEQTRFGCQNKQQGEQVRSLLHKWLLQGRALAVVVDEAGDPAGFFLSLFISDEFRQHLMGNQNRTLLGASLRYYAASKQAAVLTPAAILKAHRSEGLNLLHFSGWRDDLSAQSWEAVQELLHQSFTYLHRGYHLKSFLKEVYGEGERSLYQQLGANVYKQPHEYYPDYQHFDPFLVGAVRGEVKFPLRLADVFHTPAPAIWLTRVRQKTHRLEQTAQLAYLLRLSDDEIAECLEVSVNTVYNHWYRLGRRLFGRNREKAKRVGRRECLSFIASATEVVYPLRVHTYFYHHPELARRYPLSLE